MRNVTLAVLLLAPLAAQDVNVTVLKTVVARGRLSGVWGYVAPDGRELALVGANGGTWIVETTDPRNPVERGYFTAPSSNWREITTYGHHAYSVSEHHRGIRVIDLADPARPVDRGTVLVAQITHTHTISVDPDQGRLYANGTNQGMLILDVATDPLNPRILGAWSASYVHDCYVRRGRGYLCDIYGGNLGIFDLVNPASPRLIHSFQTPARFTHNAWVTDDDTLLVTTDEVGSGYLTVYDITTPTAPVQKGIYNINNSDICHNAHLLGRACYMAHNSAGLHVCDLTDPTRPTKFASYDTSSTTSGYNGVWGCYPFQDSGVVYCSDRVNGLFLMQIDCGHANRYGDPTAASGAPAPRVYFAASLPRVGAGGLQLGLDGLQPNARFALAISSKSVAPFRLLGVTVHVDLAAALWVTGRADPQGRTRLPAPVPNDPGLAGSRVYLQLFAADTRLPSGIAASRGTWTGICR